MRQHKNYTNKPSRFHEQLLAKGYPLREAGIIYASVISSPVPRQVAKQKRRFVAAEEAVPASASQVS